MNLAIDRDWRVLASVALLGAGALLAIATLAVPFEGDYTTTVVWAAIFAAVSIPGWITLPRWRELFGLPFAALLAPAAASLGAGLAAYQAFSPPVVLAQWQISLAILSLIIATATMLAIPPAATRTMRGIRFAARVVLVAVLAAALLMIWRPAESGEFQRAALGASAILSIAAVLAFALLLSWERSTHVTRCVHCGQPIP